MAGISHDLPAAVGAPGLRRLAAVDAHIREHYDQPLSLADLTAIAGLSVAQLERHCKRIFQLTPRQMIHKARLGAASQLLAGDAPITEIALRCGYTDHSAFSRQFKALTGLSPSQYRETHRQPRKRNASPRHGAAVAILLPFNTAGRARAGAVRRGMAQRRASQSGRAPAKGFYRRRTRFWHSHCSLKISYTKSQIRDLPPSHSTASPEAPMNTKKTLALALTAALGCSLAGLAQADKLDDIIESGKLRCAVTLDFPPMGSRDAQNNPVGFDVDYCNDLAKALDVKAEIVETPFPDRIPALVSGRADVIVASTSDTLERAKTIGMSIPYFAFVKVVLTREDTGIASYEDLGPPGRRHRRHLRGAGPGEGQQGLGRRQGSFRAYQSEADTALAISQGHIDATVVSSTVAASWIKSGKYKGLKIAGDAPYDIDYVALGAKRNEYGLLNYLNLFINQQVRTGRYAELAQKWVGGTAPELTTSAVYR